MMNDITSLNFVISDIEGITDDLIEFEAHIDVDDDGGIEGISLDPKNGPQYIDPEEWETAVSVIERLINNSLKNQRTQVAMKALCSEFENRLDDLRMNSVDPEDNEPPAYRHNVPDFRAAG